MHLIDSLDPGGAERTAVNLVNTLPRDHILPYLCITRRSGTLSTLIADDVRCLELNRTRSVDLAALSRLHRYIRRHGIQILHAHSTSIFTAALVSLAPPFPKVVWHVHFGGMVDHSQAPIYRWLALRAAAVVAVSEDLAAWATDYVGILPKDVHFVPNFVSFDQPAGERAKSLPGISGKRIVCVANLRPEKDHLTLLRSMSDVVAREPDAHLLLVGDDSDHEYISQIRQQIASTGLDTNVSMLGVRENIPALLAGCDVGVLSSTAEGMPLALIEYGAAGLPAIATRVGQCEDVLDHGRAGRLIDPGDADALADALVHLLRSASDRHELASRFRARARDHYGAAAVVHKLQNIYRGVLALDKETETAVPMGS